MSNSNHPNQAPQTGVDEDPDREPSQGPPTASFRLIENPGKPGVEIKHVQAHSHRIVPLVIGMIVISMMGLTLLGRGDGEGSGLLANMMELARDHPFWANVAKFVVIAVIAYFGFRIARAALGTLTMRVDQHSFEAKKGILGVGIFRSFSRSQIKGLKQSSWKEKQRNASMGNMETVHYWKLELQGDKSITLLTNETNPSDTDWLGQYLSDWFEVPFVKEKL